MSAETAQWLMITLIAPMASFGAAPGNTKRGTEARPTKSALLGLLGAALGLRRDDWQAQEALAAGYQVATRTRAAGGLVRDFHTYQSLNQTSKPPPQTRVEALSRLDKLETTVTERYYRADVAYDAAFRASPTARWSLNALAAALKRPVFTLYLGRKSCPLSWPLDPEVTPPSSLMVAFARREAALVERGEGLGRAARALRLASGEIAVEDPSWAPAGATMRREMRRDQPGDRQRSHFGERAEWVFSLGSAGDRE